MVKCGRWKQWISGDSLGLHRGKKDEFYVQGLGRRGEWEKETREWKKKAKEGANKEGGQKEQELGE